MRKRDEAASERVEYCKVRVKDDPIKRFTRQRWYNVQSVLIIIYDRSIARSVRPSIDFLPHLRHPPENRLRHIKVPRQKIPKRDVPVNF